MWATCLRMENEGRFFIKTPVEKIYKSPSNAGIFLQSRTVNRIVHGFTQVAHNFLGISFYGAMERSRISSSSRNLGSCVLKEVIFWTACMTVV